jgi:hypothetical protein
MNNQCEQQVNIHLNKLKSTREIIKKSLDSLVAFDIVEESIYTYHVTSAEFSDARTEFNSAIMAYARACKSECARLNKEIRHG